MDKEEKKLREMLKELGYEKADQILKSDVISPSERKAMLAGILADVIKNRNSNSSKVGKNSETVEQSDFYLGFVSDTHSKLYLLENYLNLLYSIDGKCVVTGDISNGSNHAHGHDSSLQETMNLTDDVFSVADVLKRYPNMVIGYVEGNHDQWLSNDTSIYLGEMANKIAGVPDAYAKNVKMVTQNVMHNGKKVPFTFLLVHGEGMPYDVVNSLKRALEKATRQNVDAIIFGHTHKMGSATLSLLNQNTNGKWTERQITSYNPGTVLEGAEYADKAGFPANTPFDGSVLHCKVVEDKDGKIKKVIDLENIMSVVPKKDRAVVDALKNKLAILGAKKYTDKQQIIDSYQKLVEQYGKKGFTFDTTEDGHYLVGISGTSDMYSPTNTKAVKAKIKADLAHIVEVAGEIPNLSIVLNGDLVYDYNKGYIAKKDYCADVVADIQDLCEILKPVESKIVAINSGKMEEGIMAVERDKCNGRIGGDGAKKLKELANYASQVLQLDESEAYEPYDKAEMHSKQLAIQNNMVNDSNQIELDRAFSDYVKKQTKHMSQEEAEEYLSEIFLDTNAEKKIKETLVKELREKHKILDISNPDDKRVIDRIFPLSNIDLREPNKNLIGNIFAKFLGISKAKVKLNPVMNAPTQFKITDAKGKSKTVWSYYCASLPKFLRELPPKLVVKGEPPDVVLLNNYTTKSSTDLQEFTTQIRVSYMNSRGVKKVKDVLVMDSGSFAYSKYLTSGKVPANLLYKVVDVEPIYQSVLPKDSVNYAKVKDTHPVIEKYHYESVFDSTNVTKRAVKKLVNTSLKQTLNKFDEKNIKKSNDELADGLTDVLSESSASSKMWGEIWSTE